jgi:hypothetical protein
VVTRNNAEPAPGVPARVAKAAGRLRLREDLRDREAKAGEDLPAVECVALAQFRHLLARAKDDHGATLRVDPPDERHDGPAMQLILAATSRGVSDDETTSTARSGETGQGPFGRWRLGRRSQRTNATSGTTTVSGWRAR